MFDSYTANEIHIICKLNTHLFPLQCISTFYKIIFRETICGTLISGAKLYLRQVHIDIKYYLFIFILNVFVTFIPLSTYSYSGLTYIIFISVFNQLDTQNVFHNKFYFMSLHVSSTCARNM